VATWETRTAKSGRRERRNPADETCDPTDETCDPTDETCDPADETCDPADENRQTAARIRQAPGEIREGGALGKSRPGPPGGTVLQSRSVLTTLPRPFLGPGTDDQTRRTSTTAVSNIHDVSPATSPISYDPNSRIAYDVNSAVNTSWTRPATHELPANPHIGRIFVVGNSAVTDSYRAHSLRRHLLDHS